MLNDCKSFLKADFWHENLQYKLNHLLNILCTLDLYQFSLGIKNYYLDRKQMKNVYCNFLKYDELSRSRVFFIED